MAILSLKTFAGKMTVDVEVEVEIDLINTADQAPLIWFVAHNWVHNGGYGLADTPQAWVPVYAVERREYYWLYVDSFVNPTVVKLHPYDHKSLSPPHPAAVFFDAAHYFSCCLNAWAHKQEKVLRKMTSEKRLEWYGEFLLAEDAPWGRLYAHTLAPTNNDEYIEVNFIDGSSVFLTANGPIFICPTAAHRLTNAWGMLSREARLEDLPDDWCYRT